MRSGERPKFNRKRTTLLKGSAFYILLAVWVMLPTTPYCQKKAALTHEAMWMLYRVGTPAVSPDGKWFVHSVTEPSYKQEEQVSDLWIAPVDATSKPRRITTGKAGEGSYAWSPDGSYIAFTAKREGDEATQIYLLNMLEGGEAQRLTRISTGVRSPVWRPDGKMLLFTSLHFPTCFHDSCNAKKSAEKKALPYQARVFTHFPIRNWDTWRDDKRAHLYVQHIDSSEARNLFAGFALADSSGFYLDRACWSPDGKSIVFTGTDEWETQAYREAEGQIYQMDVSNGMVSRYSEKAMQFASPQFSKKGDYLYCMRTAANNGQVYNLTRLVRYRWPKMDSALVVGDSLDREILEYSLIGEGIYFIAEDKGRNRAYHCKTDGSEMHRIDRANKGSLSGLSLSDNVPTVCLVNWESVDAPSEIVRIDERGEIIPLTRWNLQALDSVELSGSETFWFQSRRGKQIRNLLIKPPHFDPKRKYPLFVVMHGGPAGSWKESWSYRWNYHLLASPGYVVLLTDYTGSTGYGEKFSQDILGDPFRGPAEEINEAAAYVINKYTWIDGGRQAAGGASYGGHLANWMQATTRHYRCLISHAGLVNSISQWGTSDAIFHREVINGGTPWSGAALWKDQNPVFYAEQFQTPMLVTVGEQDFRVPLNNSIETWNVLQRRKVPSRLIVFPEENHWILKAENSRFFYRELHAWLAKYLAP